MGPNERERQLLREGKKIFGIDEVGRSSIAGPLGLAIVGYDFNALRNWLALLDKVDDSKGLSEIQKLDAFGWITHACCHYKFTLEECKKDLIEPYKNGLRNLMSRFTIREGDIVFVDNGIARYVPDEFQHSVEEHVKGDTKFITIASASIIAKVYRDGYMRDLHNKYSQYDWASNVGYPTPKHWKAIEEHGLSKHHRTFFNKVAKYV